MFLLASAGDTLPVFAIKHLLCENRMSFFTIFKPSSNNIHLKLGMFVAFNNMCKHLRYVFLREERVDFYLI